MLTALTAKRTEVEGLDVLSISHYIDLYAFFVA